MRSHSTKNQLKEKSPEAKFFLSNTLRALLLFKIQKNSVFSVIFRSSASLTRSQCIWHVPLRLFLLSGAPHAHLASSWRRWHDGPPSPESSAASGPPVAADRGQERRLNAVPRRPAPPGSPCGLMHASARPCTATATGKDRTRSLPPTGPRRPVLSNSLLSTDLQLD